MVYEFIAAIGLVFIFEGILPFVAPRVWRKMVVFVALHRDKVLRLYGFNAMLIGLAIFLFAHQMR
ncbi:MAG: DUF2065 domain-containing protein [Pseudomonadota bacterium]|nr:DUF2065 domain-containing protein [Gammaproteobacteria bacterium]MBU1558868.1 DUF2065 domain-containing protein [Gammaproteobacteria bacterium]MBU1628520.1 DUF2065 domain-containing protein [Gammaproteobacteria bacterium]MBU1927285.1 DUF2065 domain-containing protein [Gammaproteobacteria bacterium]MBU2546336.1 DUF2065 domain-containing protein [Gammaproteobacteria bacterium]